MDIVTPSFRSEFRALFPGGGTDGGLLEMGEQLKNTNSEAVYYDFSKASMSIAQLKAKMRGLVNIIWINGWIESVSRHGLGNFDLVVATGVLHHLKNPQKGLSMLHDIQFEHGGAKFMVYGKNGRTGVYIVQELLRKINSQSQSLDNEIHSANVILEILPKSHWFHHIVFTETKVDGNAGIYDLLLHKRDVAYSNRELHIWLEKGGYNFVDFVLSTDSIKVSLKHRNLNAFKQLYDKLLRLNIRAQQRVGEIIWGRAFKQNFYASKQRSNEK